jgi:uncharacterized protein YdeI (BOF family)
MNKKILIIFIVMLVTTLAFACNRKNEGQVNPTNESGKNVLDYKNETTTDANITENKTWENSSYLVF